MDEQGTKRAGGGLALPRFSLKGLFYATTFVCIFAALLNNPFGHIPRGIAQELLALFSLSVFLLATLDCVQYRTQIGRGAWTVPAISFILFLWSTVQFLVEMPVNYGK
jgi:hypothetical protein